MTTTDTAPAPETFDLTCSRCRPLFTHGPPRPDCGRCHGAGSYSVTYHEVTYRIVTTTTYEISTSVDLDNFDGLLDHLTHTDTWCDPPPTESVDGDISHVEIQIDGDWHPVERDFRNTADGWEWVWTLAGVKRSDPDVLIRDALRR